MKSSIAGNIKTLRKERSLTQEQLAEVLGVTVGAVHKWEVGMSVPEIKMIMNLADFFEVSVDMLLGYEPTGGSLEKRLAQVEQYISDKNFEEAVLEAEKLLKKYPGNFKVVFNSAIVYRCRYFLDKNNEMLEKSNQMFRQAIPLLYQNDKPCVNEAVILNYIAENYLAMGKTEEGLEILKRNNIKTSNSARIGFEYAVKLDNSKSAKPYLEESFAVLTERMIFTMCGFGFFYADKKSKQCLEVIDWLLQYLESVKIDRDAIAWVDKYVPILVLQRVIWEMEFTKKTDVKEEVYRAYKLAQKYDAEQIINMQGIRFLEDMDIVLFSEDDMGKTSVEALENFIFHREPTTKVVKIVKEIWEGLKADESQK